MKYKAGDERCQMELGRRNLLLVAEHHAREEFRLRSLRRRQKSAFKDIKLKFADLSKESWFSIPQACEKLFGKSVCCIKREQAVWRIVSLEPIRERGRFLLRSDRGFVESRHVRRNWKGALSAWRLESRC